LGGMGLPGAVNYPNGACSGKGQRRRFAPAGGVKGGVAT